MGWYDDAKKVATSGAQQLMNFVQGGAQPLRGDTSVANALIKGTTQPLQVNNGFVYESAGAAVDPKKVKTPTVKPPTIKPETIKPPTIKPPTIKPETVSTGNISANIGGGGASANIGGNFINDPKFRDFMTMLFPPDIIATANILRGTAADKTFEENLYQIYQNSRNISTNTPLGRSDGMTETQKKDEVVKRTPFGNVTMPPSSQSGVDIPNNGVVSGYQTEFPGKFTQYKKASWEGMMPEEQDPSGAIGKRYRLLQQNLAANESRLGQGEQEALNRRFASMGAQNSGAALRNSQLQGDISNRRLLEQQNALGAAESGEKQSAIEAANNRALAQAQMKIGSEDSRRAANQAMQQMELGNYQFEKQYGLAEREMALNEQVVPANLEIQKEMLKISKQGVLAQILSGIGGEGGIKPITEWFT